MADKLNIYVLGDYQPHSADGLLEFSAQNAWLLRDDFLFHFFRFDDSLPKNHYQETVVDGFRIHTFGTRTLSKLFLPLKFIRWLKELKPGNGIFHLNHIYTYNNYVVAKILVKNRIPYLITPHDSYVYRDEFRHTKTFLKRLYRDVLVRIRDKYVFEHAQVVHELTDRHIDVIKKFTDAPIVVIPNQIRDIGISFDAAKLKPQICYIGRYDIFQKGIDRCIEAFAVFKKLSPDYAEHRLILLGPATSAALQQISALCRQSGLRENVDVLFPGRVSEEERNRILAESMIYLQMSRFEGFGLSVIQALSSFTPVILSSEIPTSGIIDACNGGFVASTAQEAAAAMEKIFQMSSAAYQEIADNARACYMREFHPEIIKQRLKKIYLQTAEAATYK